MEGVAYSRGGGLNISTPQSGRKVPKIVVNCSLRYLICVCVYASEKQCVYAQNLRLRFSRNTVTFFTALRTVCVYPFDKLRYAYTQEYLIGTRMCNSAVCNAKGYSEGLPALRKCGPRIHGQTKNPWFAFSKAGQAFAVSVNATASGVAHPSSY